MTDPMSRARVERLLRGERRIDDITRLFLYLRDRCDGRESVQEIGDFVAHHDERTKGLITNKTRDWATVANFFATYHEGNQLDGRRLPSYFPEFLSAALRRAGSPLFKRNSGMTLQEAHKLLPRTINRFTKNADGTFGVSRETTPADIDLIRCLSNNLVVEPAFDDDRLFLDFVAALKSNGDITKEEMRAVAPLKPFVTLFAISAMHNCSVRLDDGNSVVLDVIPNYKNALIVEAAVRISVEGTNRTEGLKLFRVVEDGEPALNWKIPVEENAMRMSSGIFETSLLAGQYCEPRLLEKDLPWNFPIEVNQNGLLAPLS